MKNRIKFLGLAVLAVIVQSCGFGYSAVQNFTPLDTTATTINCETPPQNVELIFEGEKVNFDYDKIGVIEVQGDQTSNDKEMLEKIKVLSKSKCCDAIINLKRTYTDRQSGLIFNSEYNRDYSAITYHGIAVKKKVKIE